MLLNFAVTLALIHAVREPEGVAPAVEIETAPEHRRRHASPAKPPPPSQPHRIENNSWLTCLDGTPSCCSCAQIDSIIGSGPQSIQMNSRSGRSTVARR
jgi:hypothetical protein